MRTPGFSVSRVRVARLLSACAAMAVPSVASAGISYVPSSSSVTITHDANSSSGGVDKTSSLAPPTSSSMTSFQLNNTIGGTTQSIAKGSTGTVTNPTTATFSLAAGTGVTQVDPTHVWGPSSLKFNLNGVWNTGTTAFGPTATGYFSMGYAGSVGGVGSSAQVIINLTFKDNLGNNLRSAISYTDTITAAGGFSKTFTSSVPFTGGSVAANKQVKVNGTIEFKADNGGGPVDLSPVNFDCGGAPPTATFVSSGGSFDDPANWNGTGPNFIVEAGSTLPSVPSAAGDRARIVNLGGAPGGIRVIDLPSSVTLGTLDIDDDDGVQIDPVGAGALNFATLGGDAVIHTGNSQGASQTDIEAPVNMSSALTVAVDSDSPFAAGRHHRTPGTPNGYQGVLNLRGVIAGSQAMTSIADGTLGLHGTSPNTFTGGLHAMAGFVDANKTGALGAGTATISDSQLNYNTAGASAANTVTQVSNLGQFTLSDITITPNDRVSISDLAAVDAVDLTQFNTNAAIGSINLQLAPGAMIAHQQFAPDVATGNPTGLDPNTPLYIFGVSRFFGNQNITVGSDSVSAWRGFGGPRGDFSFGDGGQGQVGIAGHAELVSLRGTMTISSKLVAVGPTAPSLTIRGGGLVIIDAPPTPFPGPITVESGGLAIISGWTPQSILVQSGASMGGPGSNAPLTIQDNGHISPGDNGGFQSIGTFHAFSSLTLNNLTQWDMDLDVPGVVGGPNDLVTVDGACTLDGVVNVNGLENFGPGIYTLGIFNGSVINNGMSLGIVPPEYQYDLIVTQNRGIDPQQLLLIVSAVPEPSSIACVAAAGLIVGRRVRRQRAGSC